MSVYVNITQTQHRLHAAIDPRLRCTGSIPVPVVYAITDIVPYHPGLATPVMLMSSLLEGMIMVVATILEKCLETFKHLIGENGSPTPWNVEMCNFVLHISRNVVTLNNGGSFT